MDAIGSMVRAHALAGADPAAAEAICREVIDAERDNGFALHLLGVLHLRGGALPEARSVLRRAVTARPDHLESRLALAEACVRAEEDGTAARELDAVLAVRPGHAGALVALTYIRVRQGDAVQASALAKRAREAAPDAVDPLVALGTVLAAQRQFVRARNVLREAVARDPRHGHAHLNLGNVLLDLNEEEAAETHIHRATGLIPDSAEAWASLGFLLAGADRLSEAITACDRALALRPTFAQAYWNRSFAELRAGDFARGWADYEWRRRHPLFGPGSHVLSGEEWDGGDLFGRRLLVNATQGLGDTIQLARYLPLLAARGADVTLICPMPLLRLLAPLPIRLLPRGTPPPPYDCWIDQMSLPGRFGTTAGTIPTAQGYLHAEPLPASGTGLRVGIVCAGNPCHSNDFRRSMAPADMAPLRAVPGVTFTSLQVGPASGELGRLFGIPDNAAELRDMAATARVVAGLDLIVSVDTAVAHLAGALGRQVWIFLPRAPDWRWLAGRCDSPWYASARLFRQPRAGDWPSVVTEVADALTRRSHAIG